MSRLFAHRHQSLTERFCSGFIINVETLCWEWIGSLSNGYGRLKNNYKSLQAHRVSYELTKGTIQRGLEIDHLCRNRKCVNPDHLEVVTTKINQERSVRATKALCSKGHPLDGITKRKAKKYPQRFCKTCLRLRGRTN